MSYQITQVQYRDEWVVAFQRGATYLKDCTTTEMMVRGNSAIFPIQGAAPRMVERGVNGLIPSRERTDTQVTVNLREKHTLENQTSFNIFTAHSDLREAMQNAGALTAAREVDNEIIENALTTATNQFNGGTAITLTFGNVVDILSELRENNVYGGDEICCVWTPKAWARIQTFDRATSFDYVDRKPLMGNQDLPFRWLGATHMVHTGTPNIGTATAECYAFAKPAVGHAINEGEIRTAIGYDEEQDYSFARHTIFHGASTLQQSGILKIIHDDTAAIS